MVTRSHLNTAKAQKGQYLLHLPQICHVILQNKCAIGAVLVFPNSPLCCRSFTGDLVESFLQDRDEAAWFWSQDRVTVPTQTMPGL